MKSLSPAGISGVEKNSSPQEPVNICMHVLTQARNDVRVMREARTLAQAGFVVHIVDIESDPTRPSAESLDGVYLKHLPVSSEFAVTRFRKWTLLRAAGMFIGSVRHLVGTPADIYHAHDEATLPGCAIAAWLRRKPLIFDAHELPLNEMSIRWAWLLFLFKVLFKVVLPRCAGVITVSPPIVQEIRTTYHPRLLTLVRNIPPYQEVERSDRLRQALGLNSQTRVALYQGILQANRGLKRLISAAHFLEPGNVIVLMGQDMRGSRTQLAEFIAHEGVEDRVKLLPPVPYHELLTWTASADIGLIIYDPAYSLNVQMCLPNKFFEYLMAGLPVLSSNLVAITPVLQTYGVGRMVSSLEPQAVGTALNDLLRDQEALAEMSANARRTARDTFCWEQEHVHLLNLYQDVIAQQGIKSRRR